MMFAVLTVFCASVWAKDMPTKDIVDTAVAAGTIQYAGESSAGGRTGGDVEGNGSIYGFCADGCGIRETSGGNAGKSVKPENQEKLKAILLYHVVAGEVTSKQVVKLHSAKTVGGQELTIKTAGGKVMVNDATVIKADVMATNGVIHVIDTVLLPPQ